MFAITLILALTVGCLGQQAGDITQEYHPPLPIQVCDATGCHVEDTALVIDGDYRWLYSAADGTTSCQTDAGWDPELCPDGLTCALNCAVNGIDQDGYNNVHGVSTSGDTVRMNYLTESASGTAIGSRIYLVTADDKYRMFKLKNRELAFDVDTSKLECGMNGALYFVEMEEDGGTASYPSNTAGAKYGTGYCDAQCPHYLRLSAGEINLGGSTPFGLCCIEMDLWEANSWAGTFTTHGCNIEGYYVCEGIDCGDDADRYNGVCDKDGCEFGSFRLNDHYYYGGNTSYEVDSTQPFTVVTQFITDDGTDDGTLVEIRRIYVQNGVVIQNSRVHFDGVPEYDSITNDFCTDVKDVFENVDDFTPKGGLNSMGEAWDRGMVLALSVWEDSTGHMLWLDSVLPTDADPSTPGVWRGPCSIDSGDPDDMHQLYPDSYVTFSNIKVGIINSTFPIRF